MRPFSVLRIESCRRLCFASRCVLPSVRRVDSVRIQATGLRADRKRKTTSGRSYTFGRSGAGIRRRRNIKPFPVSFVCFFYYSARRAHWLLARTFKEDRERPHGFRLDCWGSTVQAAEAAARSLAAMHGLGGPPTAGSETPPGTNAGAAGGRSSSSGTLLNGGGGDCKTSSFSTPDFYRTPCSFQLPGMMFSPGIHRAVPARCTVSCFRATEYLVNGSYGRAGIP